jgi:hypothetical protein
MSIAAWIEIVLNVLRTCVAFDICCVVRRAGGCLRLSSRVAVRFVDLTPCTDRVGGQVGLGSKKVAKKRKEIRARERKEKRREGCIYICIRLCGVGWVPNCEEGGNV